MIKSSVIITSYKNRKISFLEKDNKINQLSIESDSTIVGNIYLGRVKHVVKNLNACFVEIKQDTLAFLSFNDLYGDIKIVEGNEILVQVIKDASKGKEAVVSMKLSLQGLYSVVELSDSNISISKKIAGEVRSDIKNAVNGLTNYGLIIRTNAKNLTDYNILKEEIKLLSDSLSTLIYTSKTRKACSLIRECEPEYVAFVKGLPLGSFDRILTDLEEVKNYFPNSIYYNDEYPLSKLYSIETKINELLSKQVWLKSGGNIVIEYTEAMTVIDVNTAKNMSKHNKEETVLEINIEASKEIARQLRLRNISGIIIIDFINMSNEENNKILADIIKDELKLDSVRCDYIEMTKLGLVELVRRKIKAPIYEII